MTKFLIGTLAPLTLLIGFSTLASETKSGSSPVPVDLGLDPKYAIPEKRNFPVSQDLNPCQDFHAYVCSKAEQSFNLRPDRRSHTFSFNDSYERILLKRQAFMAELPNTEHLGPSAEQFRSFYMACMDEKAKASSEKNEIQTLLTELAPLKSAEQVLEWSVDGIAKGERGLLDFDSVNNQEDSLKLDVYLNVSLMKLPDHKYYDNQALLKDYEKMLTSFFQVIRPQEGSTKAAQRAAAQVKLQKDFIRIYPVASVRRDRWSEKHSMTQAEAIKAFPAYPLQNILSLVPAKALVTIPVQEGLKFINDHLHDYDVQVWKDFILIQNLNGVIDDSNPGYYQKKFAFEQKFFGGPTLRPVRQERCTNMVTGHFTREVDAAMVERMFPNFDQKKIEDIVASIRASITKGIEKNEWLSEGARKEALEKIKTAKMQLVQPHTEREWDFHPLRLYSKTDLWRNEKIYHQAGITKVLKELGEPANQEAWDMGPLTINAYYSAPENKFVLPVGILQYPFFIPEGDMIENLGAVGAVTGHELGHGIDDKGSKYDHKGRLIQWMSDQDLKEFQGRSNKLVKQFQDAGFDGKLTLGENSADLVGLSFAYQAAFPKGRGSVEDKKRFFMSYGRVWCSVGRPDFWELLKKTDPHSLGYARINEQMKHQPGFAEAFQCKAGDKMFLPESERTSIW